MRAATARRTALRGLALALAAVLPRAAPADDLPEAAARLQPRAGREDRLRIEYENSQALSVLDAGGEPVAGQESRAVTRRIDATVELEWTRVSPEGLLAEGRITEIASVALGDWRAERPDAAGLRFTLGLWPGKDARAEIAWKPGELGRLRRLTRRAEGAAELAAALEAPLAAMARIYPALDAPALPFGKKVAFAEDFALLGGLRLRADHEIEHLGLVAEAAAPGAASPPPVRARLEGAVRQTVAGAPAAVQRSAGLFPGSVACAHDLERGLPHDLSIDKVARIPVPDGELPLVRTLTHTYRVRVRAVEAK